MRDYSTLSDAEINAKLAEKMGWVHRIFFGDERWWVGDKPGRDYDNWAPCTSRDDLAVVVGTMLPIQCRLIGEALQETDAFKESGDAIQFILTCSPRIIAEACLGVLEG